MKFSPVCFLVLSLMASAAHAKPWIFSIMPSGNVYFCETQKDDLETYRMAKQATAVVEDKMSKSDESGKEKLKPLLEYSKQNEESVLKILAESDRKLMVSAIIDVDRETILAEKDLVGKPGEGRIDFVPSQVQDNQVIVPSGKITMRVYGSKFCERYLNSGKEVTKTFNEILAELFK